MPNRMLDRLSMKARHRLAAFADVREHRPEQQRDQQDLQDFALRECRHERVRNDVHQEVDGRLTVRLRGIRCDFLAVQRSRIDVEADARPQQVRRREAEQQCERRDDFEVQQRLAADAPDLLHVLHPGDAGHDRTEDDRSDHHLDELDEGIAERLHVDGEGRIEMAERDTDDDRHDHLDVQHFVDRFLHDVSCDVGEPMACHAAHHANE